MQIEALRNGKTDRMESRKETKPLIIRGARQVGKTWLRKVKAEENLQSKSLKVYREKYNPPISIRTSMRDYRKESWLLSIPLYAIGTDFLDG